jgi:hypothetical protein
MNRPARGRLASNNSLEISDVAVNGAPGGFERVARFRRARRTGMRDCVPVLQSHHNGGDAPDRLGAN